MTKGFVRYNGNEMVVESLEDFDWVVIAMRKTTQDDTNYAMAIEGTEEWLNEIPPLNLPVVVRYNHTSKQFHYYKEGSYVGFSVPGMDPFDALAIAEIAGSYITAKLTAALNKADKYIGSNSSVIPRSRRLVITNPVDDSKLEVRLPDNLLTLF